PGMTANVPVGFVEYNGRRLGITSASPEPGEHTEEVLSSLPTSVQLPPSIATPRRPLKGLRVLDLGVIVYGGEVGRMFADMGADVIKVENRAYPDGARAAAGMNTSFHAGHRRKRSLGLNLRSDRGKDVFKQIARKSDVLLSNFKPGTLESLGLG